MFNLEEYKKNMKSGPDHVHLIAHYWDVKGKDFDEKKDAQKAIRRFVKSARSLLIISGNDIEKAKENLTVVGEWANNRGLEWTIETVLKKYIEIGTIKQEKEENLNKIKNAQMER